MAQTQSQKASRTRQDAEEVEAKSTRNQALLEETDDLLDEIEDLLNSTEQEEIERKRYAAMLKGWAARQDRLDSACKQACEGCWCGRA